MNMGRFHEIDRETDFLFPPSVQGWLPNEHLARYIANVVESLDLSAMERAYAGRGSAAYHPATLMSLLIFGYATGVFSSRRIERATYDSIAFRYLACNRHPDHDTLANFRRRFGGEFKSLLVQVLPIAHANRFSQFARVSLDGTKMHANASRHSALSYGHAEKLEVHLNNEVEELLALAEQAEQGNVPDGMNVPDEIARREDQLKAIAQAKSKIEARAKERYERETREYDAKVKAREEKEAKTGKKPRGTAPTVPSETPRAQDQVNLTDDESRIMKVAAGGFEQCYNAQAMVDTESLLVVVADVSQDANDKQQIVPMLERLDTLPEGLNSPAVLLADAGYYSEDNVDACCEAQIEPLIAVGRESHHENWKTRFGEPEPLVADATRVETMRHRLTTRAGKKEYALRKQTVEPVFGIIKAVMKFRQFMLRGLQHVRNEWTLVCLAWNLKRMAVLRPEFAGCG